MIMTTLVPEQSNQLTLRQIFQNNSKLKHRTSYTFECLDNISTRIHSFVKIKRSLQLFIWNHWKSQEPNLSLISEVTDRANGSWIKIIIWRALPFRGLLELRRSCSWFLPGPVSSVSVNQPLPRWQNALFYPVMLLPWLCEFLPHCGTSIFHV